MWPTHLLSYTILTRAMNLFTRKDAGCVLAGPLKDSASLTSACGWNPPAWWWQMMLMQPFKTMCFSLFDLGNYLVTTWTYTNFILFDQSGAPWSPSNCAHMLQDTFCWPAEGDVVTPFPYHPLRLTLLFSLRSFLSGVEPLFVVQPVLPRAPFLWQNCTGFSAQSFSGTGIVCFCV